MTFKELAPFVIAATSIICILIAIKIKKEDILTIDGIFSVVGVVLGLIITSLNLIYSNNYLITLGPILAIACLLYLRFRNKILTNNMEFNLNFDSRTLKAINILYWVCISVALFSYQQAPPYHRPPIFFICISFGVALLGVEIISSKFKDNFDIFRMMFKILLISLVLRTSAYFISPYPVGSDPWAHAEYIDCFLQFHHTSVPSYPHGTGVGEYYCSYPIMHLLTCTLKLIGDIDIKESMYIIGIVLMLSTVFIYLIVKNITGKINLALLCMLILNFTEFHIMWSVQVIAMSLGIVFYTILIYILLKKDKKHNLIYTPLLILLFFIIIWTHTVSSFIVLVSLISVSVGSTLYHTIYTKNKPNESLVSITFCTLFAVLLLHHWMDPNYSFFDAVARGLVNSLSKEAEFLVRPAVSNVAGNLTTILDIIGFLGYIFFGIIGSLYVFSRKYTGKTKVSMVFMLVILYFVFFVFPLFGMSNIAPYRWPAFIYISFVLFVGIGLSILVSTLRIKHKAMIFFIILFTLSFFMVTNSMSNTDSPIYGKEINQRLLWTESEMTMFNNINSTYSGLFVGDIQTMARPFRIDLKRGGTVYHLTPNGSIRIVEWNRMNTNMVIWRRTSLKRPVLMSGGIQFLGIEFKKSLDCNFSCIYDIGEARAYIGYVIEKKHQIV